MRKLFLVLLLATGIAQAQDTHLTFSAGQANHIPHIESEAKIAEAAVAVGLQLDFFETDFVFGPEVRAFATRSGNNILPGGTASFLTGYDNDKFRIAGGLGLINPVDRDLHAPEINVFRGVFISEVATGAFFVRGEWYTNLKTYFYSYTVQAGFRIKL